jgi:hypothetical protein
MKKSNIKFLQIFVILIIVILGISYFFNYKEGADPCHKVKVEDNFCINRIDCRVLKGRCKTPGPTGRFGKPTCIEYNPSTCVDK